MSQVSGMRTSSSVGDGRGSGPDGQAEGEEDDESSSSSSSRLVAAEKQCELEEFRRQWKEEVLSEKNAKDVAAPLPLEKIVEEDALRLFMEGVEHEQNGEMYEAIAKYRKAVHLMPDIERKAFDLSRRNNNNNKKVVERLNTPPPPPRPQAAVNNTAVDENGKDLVNLFSTLTRLCQPEMETKVVHISCLPMEVLINVVKWVVSSELDLRSLENVSEVCKGFYLAARSSDVWRLVCLKTWGLNSLPPKFDGCSWRSLYLSRPRVRLDGCYIARTTYMREGERSFTDHQFHRAWHVVQYYRLVRFFPGGKVVMTTTAEEPCQAVKMFVSNSDGSGIPGCLAGVYQTVKDRVICVAKSNSLVGSTTATAAPNNKVRSRRNKRGGSSGGGGGGFEVPDQVFHFELELRGKRFKQLHWISYAVVSLYKSSGREQTTDFDVSNSNNYSPMHFSPVKSYRRNVADFPLGH